MPFICTDSRVEQALSCSPPSCRCHCHPYLRALGGDKSDVTTARWAKSWAAAPRTPVILRANGVRETCAAGVQADETEQRRGASPSVLLLLLLVVPLYGGRNLARTSGSQLDCRHRLYVKSHQAALIVPRDQPLLSLRRVRTSSLAR